MPVFSYDRQLLVDSVILEHNLPQSLVEVLAEHHITSESVLTKVTEQDFADVKLVVGQKIILRRVIATLLKQPTSAVAMTARFPEWLFL